ncbi:MAG TPA: glycosyltransferase [Solirubrobacterales bacterium]|nr:glycosyltransferase [Solirubrobacterales bacterium]
MSTVPDLSVVVATRDRRERLACLLGALQEQTLPPERFEVIVVDDGSCDGTGQWLAGRLGRGSLCLRVIRRERPAGPAVARNEGWRDARGALVAFTDDDCEPAPRWLERLLVASADREGHLLQGRTEPIPRERERIGIHSRTIASDTLGPWFQTCNVAYPREVLERLGGFDESFPSPGAEDTDLAWRAIEAGAPASYVPDALVHHAVNQLGALGQLRVALRWTDASWVFGRHAGLRRELHRGIFWKPSHERALLALLGLGLARRSPAALVLLLPYYREARGRLAPLGGSRRDVPYLFVHDLVETAGAARGALRYGVPVV